MPKKPAINAYALFVEDKRRKSHFEGDPYKYFGPAWQALPDYERAKYTERAKELKYQKKSDLECKFTTSGQSYAEVERIRAEKEAKMREMKQNIEDLVATLAMKDEMAFQSFFLMHVNYFCASDQGLYYPAEVGLVKFSLNNGIEDFYHKILNPGQFPTGSFRSAMEYSKETHNLPCPPDPNIAEKDFDKIDREIKEFLLGKEGWTQAVNAYKQTKKPIVLPPIFTYYNKEMLHYNKDNDVVVKSFMENLSDGMRQYNIRVYELTRLFYELCNACAQSAGREYGFPSIIAAQAELERDVFSHSAGLACPFHEDGDYVYHCSLSWAKRWGFVMADFCCKHLGIRLVPGKHCPIKAAPFQRIELPAHMQEPVVTRRVQPAPCPMPLTAPSQVELTKKRVPIKEPLKELRQPQASCMDTLAMQFSEKLKTSSKPEGSVRGESRGVAGAVPVVGAGRGAAVAKKLGMLSTESVAAAGRGRRLQDSSGN